MANTVSAAYQTLVAAFSDAVGDGPSAVRIGNLNAIKSVYLDYNPEETAAIGKTLNVPLPANQTTNITDIGVSDFPNSDASMSTVAINFSLHPGASYTIRDMEQFNSAGNLRNLFLDAFLKGIHENINSAVTALLTTGNFAANAAVSCTGGIVSTAQFLSGREALSTAKVPLTDPGDLTFLAGPHVYSKQLADSSWTQESQVGADIAEEVRQQGALRVAYGAGVKEEQSMPVSGTVGSRTFTAALLHRHAIAVVTRKLPAPIGNVVDYMIQDFAGIPVRVMMGYNQVRGGVVVTVDAGYGLAVIRPDHGQIFTVAE